MNNNREIIAIIGAMDCEIAQLKNLLSDEEEINTNQFEVLKGKIDKHQVVIVRSGVGKAAAASCTQFLVDTFAPKYIINTGVAGGIGNGLQIGDVVIGKELVYHDFDATALGYAKGYICNGINSNEPTIFKSDKILVEKIEKTAIKTLSKDKVHKGRIASGDMFIGTAEKKREIKEQFGAIAAEMESTSIAHIATLNGIPFVIIRAIADLADGTKTDNFLEFEQSSAKISSNIIKNLLEEME